MNQLTIIGHLGKDAAVKRVNDREFITFSVAVTERYKNQQGVEVENTTWFDCIYSPKSTAVAQYMKKGGQVLVQGKVSAEAFQNNQGAWMAGLKLQVRGIQLLGSANGGNQAQAGQPATAPVQQPAQAAQPAQAFQPAMTEGSEDDLPF
ncbi:single-stranded DNA-binding protein [Tellurirhabdus rosea]|uniref:single-stranded DNA-binding protein n=1 Tax=Tellurirhabdus rosea TaxID=2674997 RepID=UPI002253E055|nr:single-stranded DNA-binding protein [Tellurirhabdus rosea]